MSTKRLTRHSFFFLFFCLLLTAGILKGKYAAAATNTCTVAYITNEGSSIPAQTYPQGTYLNTLPTPVREGYTFTGWYLDAELTMLVTAPYYLSVTGYDTTLVLFAGWYKIPPVNITAEYANKTAIVGSMLDPKLIKVTVTYSNGSKVVVKDFTIEDLKVANIGTNLFYILYENIGTYFTVVGIEEQFFTVTFVTNGGSTVNSISGVRIGDTISLPAEPAKSGYEFEGWYQDSAFSLPFTKDTAVNRNMVLFAKWKKIKIVEEKEVYELNTTRLSMDIAETQPVFIESYNPDLENYVAYRSSKPSVAAVSDDGIVTAKKNGKATIYVTAPDESVLKCTVQVGPEKVASIKPTVSSKKIKKGKSYTLKTKVSPSTATVKKLSYKSSNKKVATVTSKGKITGKKKGTCYITISTTDGSKLKKKVKITVY